MGLTRRSVLAAVSAAAGLAGCAGGGTTSPTETATPESTQTATPESAETATPESTTGSPAPTVRVRDHSELGEILVGPDGLTLYMFDRDTQGSGESACTGGCLQNWPPLTVEGEPEAGEGVTAALSTFEREDGDTQVAADGWPLYYFTPDEEPGDANGQGVNEVWWVLRPDGTVVRPDDTSTPTDTGTETPTDTPTSTDTGTETPDDTPTETDSYY